MRQLSNGEWTLTNGQVIFIAITLACMLYGLIYKIPMQEDIAQSPTTICTCPP